MATKKITELNTLTGAGVANGDLLPIVDVGTPNETKAITADELAQAITRFIPQSTEIRIELATLRSFNTSTGALLNTALYPTGVDVLLQFTKVAGQDISVRSNGVYIPPTWTTASVDLLYRISTTTSTAAVFQARLWGFAADGASGTQSTGSATTVDLTGKAADNLHRASLGTFNLSGFSGFSVYTGVQITRMGSNAADTASIIVYGVAAVLTKVS